MLLAAGFALLLAAASCSKGELEDKTVPGTEEPGTVIPENKVPMVFTAVAQETKSVISGKSILWEADDKIAIFDGTDINEFTVSSLFDGNKGANFSGNAAEVSVYAAVAPFSAMSNTSAANSRVSIKMPNTQTIIGSNIVDSEAMISTAISDGTSNLAFSNQFALLKVTLASDDIFSVKLVGNNGEPVNGTNHFYYAGDGAPYVDFDNAAGAGITLYYKASKGASNSAFPAGSYYIALWPTVFSDGYSLILTDTDGKKSLQRTSGTQTLARNGGQDIGAAIDGGTFVDCGNIKTAAELKMWKRLATQDPTVNATLGADINLNGYAWTPVETFLGTFDGQGHKIYNFTVSSGAANVGFIGTLGSSNAEEAVLKDVVFGSSNGTSYDGSSSITITGVRTGWTYGGIVGYAEKKTTISGVTTFIPVSAASAVTGKHAIGGISGSGGGGSGNGITITNCENYGPVTDNSTCETGDNSAIGGILGATDGSHTTVSSSVNHAEIHNYCIGVSRIGGVVGKAWDANATIDGCSNEGNIINEAASISDKTSNWDNTVAVGGVLGAFTASNGGLLVNKCSNSGDICFKAETNGSYRQAYGGVVGTVTYGGLIKGCYNSGKIYDDAKCNSHIGMGGILGVCNTSKFTITKADDNTPNTNDGEIFHYKNHDDCDTYVGGIVGLENSGTTPVEYSVNNGRLVSDPTGQGVANYYTGGICGASSGVIRHCTNNGYIFTWAGSLTVWIGGICGGKLKPSSISNCTNNGWLGPYNTNGSSVTGGILAILYPNTTSVSECVNTGMVTTGNFYSDGSGNTPNSSLRTFQSKNYYMGGLFGYVEVPTANVTVAEDCVVACTFGQRTGSESKDNFKGIICGLTKSTTSTGYKVTFGSSASPIQIGNTTKFQYGTNATPAVITTGDVITSTALANKWLMGSASELYSATAGSSDTSKIDFNISISTAVSAGME